MGSQLFNTMKLSIVSYINSYPFVYGLNHFKFDFKLDVILCPPSQSGQMALEKTVDFALIPVAALPLVKENYDIIPLYCIGAENSVATVLLLSNTEVGKVKKIFLDDHSLTSVKLVKLLASQYWQIEPEYVSLSINDTLSLKEGEAFLAIGDKCFDLKNKFNFCYDLFDEWHKFKDLPFVFAVWIALKGIDTSKIDELNAALLFGISNKMASLQEYLPARKKENINFYYDYLSKNINHYFDKNKEKALALFLDLVKNID